MMSIGPEISPLESWRRTRRILFAVAAGLLAVFMWMGFTQLLTTHAATGVTITPITWDVVGLDKQLTITNTNLGPNNFPVGARVCSDVTVNNMVATMVWLSSNATNYINSSGPVSYTLATLPANTCTDFYYNIDITRNLAAFKELRLYNIQVTGQGITTPISYTVPNQIYVEYLTRVQNADLFNRKLSGPSLVNLGGIYTYTLSITNTVPISYSQLVNGFTQSVPILRLMKVKASYSIPNGATIDTLYADACGWQRNASIPNVRTCVGPKPAPFSPGGLVGGTMNVTYTVKAINIGNTVLTPLIYGYHNGSPTTAEYQYEFNVGTTQGVQAVDPNPPVAAVTIAKTVAPAQAAINEILTYSIVVKNTGTANLTNMQVTDNFPLALDLVSASSTAGTVSQNPSTRNVTVTGLNLNPTQTATITIQLRVNATATVNATINNTATLTYAFNGVSFSPTSTVGFKVTGTSLPPTGGIELQQQQGEFLTLPLLLAAVLGLAGVIIFLLGFNARSRQPEWAGWISRIGLIMLAAGFVFGVIGLAINRPAAQPSIAMQPQGADATPEVNLEWLRATEAPWENFPSTSPDELSSLPDFPIPTPTLENPPTAGEPEPDTSPVVRIRIPSIGVDTIVKYVPYDGQSWLISGLRQEVAWMGDTSWPGLGGNTGFAGHVTLGDGSNGPFRALADIQPGELVIIYTEKNMYTYQVRNALVVEDEDLNVLKPSGKSEITLITCTEWDKDQETYLKRLIVYSDLMGVNPVSNQNRGN